MGSSVRVFLLADAANMTLTGSDVDEWADLSGNGQTFLDGGLSKPTFDAASSDWGGRGAVQVGGGGIMLNSSVSLGVTDVMCGLILTRIQLDVTNRFVWAQNDAVGIRSTSGTGTHIYRTGADTPVTGNIVLMNKSLLGVATDAAGSCLLYVNNVATGAGVNGTTYTDNASVSIGGTSAGSAAISHLLRSFCMFDRIPTDSERAALQTWAESQGVE